MTSVDVKTNTCINSSKKVNDKDPKLKIGNIVRISKYKNIFAKGYVVKSPKESIVLEKVKNTVPWTYVISVTYLHISVDICLTKKNCKKRNQKEFRIVKSIKSEGDKLHVKWKGYESSFNSSI